MVHVGDDDAEELANDAESFLEPCALHGVEVAVVNGGENFPLSRALWACCGDVEVELVNGAENVHESLAGVVGVELVNGIENFPEPLADHEMPSHVPQAYRKMCTNKFY